MPEPTIWDLLDSLFPEDKKAITFQCPSCHAEGHFLIVHCQCSFNVTFCAKCMTMDKRKEAIDILIDHGKECFDGRLFARLFG